MSKLLLKEITVKNLNFTCRWMPSHSPQKGTELPPDISPMDVIGNSFADKQADLAAAYHVISLNASCIALWYGCLAWRIKGAMSAFWLRWKLGGAEIRRTSKR